MRFSIRPVTVDQATQSPEFPALALAYGAEAKIAGMPPPVTKFDAYRHLEASGMFKAFGAFKDDALVGFISLIVPLIPHYGSPIGTSESFFVAKEHRHTGAGLKLLKAAELQAQTMGALGLFVSAPIASDLAKVLPRRGFTATNIVFFKCFPQFDV